MHLSQINIYPIKSLKGIRVRSAAVEERGLQYDRRWMLTGMDGVFMTQREFPRMATITTSFAEKGLVATADGFGEAVVPYEPATGDRRQVTIWQSVCEGEVCAPELNEWFSDVLATACQLVFMPDTSRRGINPRFDRGDEIVSFADGYPLMVIGEASLADLNNRIKANSDLPPRPPATSSADHPDSEAESPLLKPGGEPQLFEPLPMNRFRPNLVVSGSGAFAEDGWQEVQIGDTAFRSTKPCERCVVTTIDQAMGEFTGKEPLRTLATYRMAKDVIPDQYERLGVGQNAVLFGQNLVADGAGGTISVGDEVVIEG